MLIFFVIIFKLKASTNETTPDNFTSYDRRLRSFLHVHRFHKREDETPINAAEFELVDIKINKDSEINCDDIKTNSTSNLINSNKILDKQSTNIFFNLWETFSCGFVLCCLVLLTLVITASYYCYDKNGKVWGLLLTMGFILFMLIFGAFISGIEKLKVRNNGVY